MPPPALRPASEPVWMVTVSWPLMTAVVELILRVDPDDEMVATVELDEERLSVLMKISVSSGPPTALWQREW
jgi:hypothetical protein